MNMDINKEHTSSVFLDINFRGCNITHNGQWPGYLIQIQPQRQSLKYQIKTKARSPLPEVEGGGGGEEGGVGWTHFLEAYWCVQSYVHKEEKKRGGFPGGSVKKSLPVNAGDGGI